MRSAWRSWFWNLLLAFIVGGMAGIATAVAIMPSHAAETVAFTMMAVVLWTGAVRALLIGVVVKPRGILIRGFTSTTTIRWDEVEEITGDGEPSGGAGMLGASAPVIVRKRKSGESERVALDVLGGYGVSPVRPNPADRAITDLNAHWARWREARQAAN